MYKRKRTGLMPYSERKYSKKKLQSGGVVGSAGGYDWRDDPYEQQLATAKMNREKADAKRSSKSSTGKMPTRTFTALSGGLTGSTEAAKSIFDQAKTQYFNQIKALGDQGIAWANSVGGQEAYQKVLDLGTSLQVKLKNEKEDFDKLKENLKDTDMNTLAITGNKAFAIKKTVDAEGKVSGDFSFIKMDDYYNDPSQFEILTMNDFVNWKSNVDKNMRIDHMNDFLGKGALSQETFYDTYVKDKVGDIGLEFVKDGGIINLIGKNHYL